MLAACFGLSSCCQWGETTRDLTYHLSTHLRTASVLGPLLTAALCGLAPCLSLCTAALRVVPPPQNKDPASLRAALQQLLSDQGLSEHSEARAIARVKAQLERERDLEGIDTSNIIEEEGGRGSRRRAAARVDYK